jgi:hypothetical protein
MKYWNLNIRHDYFAKKSKRCGAAGYWLEEKKEAPIFYSNLLLTDIRKENAKFKEWGNSTSDIKNFYNIGNQNKYARLENIFLTIDEGYAWIYQPCGTIREALKESHDSEFRGKKVDGIPKSIPIRVIAHRHVKDIPLVLSSMKSNQWMSRGTFREIERDRAGSYIGNIAAIQSVIGNWESDFSVDPLSCVSSLEFETLVAKLLEEKGCFVPAYKGGFLRDVDLICKPSKPVALGGVHLDRGKSYAWQLKLQLRKADMKQIAQSGLLTICLNSDTELDELFSEKSVRQHIFGRDWLRTILAQSPLTLDWIEKSLKWLPHHHRSQQLFAQ